ncbi:MAG: type II secretion system minor pseudopilin GspH [Gammaproteobacteria bacterium]|jgi:general secretion pathway protein H|nr:type II secretion system minor pseudopilin GspH [Gammaproteobacteria bacterium]
MRLHGRSDGFSLIEILVVIVIIGIIMSIAVLSITLVGGDSQLRDEAQRIVSLVDVARDESLLQGREFGLEFMQTSYRFVEFDPLTLQWSEIIGDDTLRPRELPEELELELFIEDRRVLLKTDPARTASDEEDRSGIERYAPHILIYSSGDMSPFELHLVRRIDNSVIALQGDAAGALEIVTPEDSM